MKRHEVYREAGKARYLKILKTRLVFSRIPKCAELVLRIVFCSLPPFCRVRRDWHFRDDSEKRKLNFLLPTRRARVFFQWKKLGLPLPVSSDNLPSSMCGIAFVLGSSSPSERSSIWPELCELNTKRGR